ncbi:unnamed protein product, partial [Rotaria sp. Silwood2]
MAEIRYFGAISQRDSPIGYTKTRKWYTKIELNERYPMHTSTAQFNVWNPSKMANHGRYPGFRGISQRDSPIGYTETRKGYTKVELDELYPMNTFSTQFNIWNPSETANPGRNPGFP